MKPNTYTVRADKITDDEHQERTVYGINVNQDEISIPNIFTNKADAEHLASLCNKLDLSPVHIMEVIEDIL